MRKRAKSRGFTLVELMIVVAIIGVLAAMAVFGLSRYLASAKTAEAKSIIGNVSRAAHASYERESMNAETVAEGSESTVTAHNLCGTAAPVPGFVPAGKKYQPITADGQDFESGNALNGWKCLKYQMSQPIYFQYLYTKNGSPAAPNNPAACGTDCYEAGALGDSDSDGVLSMFARTGVVNTATGALRASTQVYVENEAE
ncbi:MAG: type II secretion system protein [Deltaproteobacteria bacterium]|nr:type II secretion system protein [Deltaproteobacteria bacterium]